MLLATGKFTKKLNDLTNLPKRYTGTFYLGATTPSFDRETQIDQEFDTPAITDDQIHAAAQQLSGVQAQIPPVFSAVKVDGVRSYTKARKGHDFELKPREIEIFEFVIEKIELPLVYFNIFCSKGTYIRAIARDFGLALQSGAFLDSLRRTEIGEYKIEDAWQLEPLIEAVKEKKKNEKTDESLQGA
jgi:tRNA pseudouridine55 synthase